MSPPPPASAVPMSTASRYDDATLDFSIATSQGFAASVNPGEVIPTLSTARAEVTT